MQPATESLDALQHSQQEGFRGSSRQAASSDAAHPTLPLCGDSIKEGPQALENGGRADNSAFHECHCAASAASTADGRAAGAEAAAQSLEIDRVTGCPVQCGLKMQRIPQPLVGLYSACNTQIQSRDDHLAESEKLHKQQHLSLEGHSDMQQAGSVHATEPASMYQQSSLSRDHVGPPHDSTAAAASSWPQSYPGQRSDNWASRHGAVELNAASWDVGLHARLELPESEKAQIEARLDGWARDLLRVGLALAPR